MKSLHFSRTLALTGLALAPVSWLATGCGGGGGGSNNSNATPGPTRTPRPTATATATRTANPTGSATPNGSATPSGSATPGATRTPTPIPTPVVPTGGQRFVTQFDIGRGQISTLNLVVSGFGGINGIITVPPIPADKVGVFLIQPGTYAVNGSFSLPNNFRFSGSLRTTAGVNLAFLAVGRTALNGQPGSITVSVGNTTFPTQNF